MDMRCFFTSRFFAKFIFLVTLLLTQNLQLAQASDLSLTAEEKNWIDQHPTIIAAGETDWAPFDFVDENGQYQGVTNDYLNIIREKTGLTIKMHIDSWDNLMSRFKAGQIDLMPAIYYSSEREKFVHYTQSYSKHAEFIFVRSGDKHYRSLQDLYGKKVAIVGGYTVENYLKQNHPEIQIVAEPDILQALNALLTGKADAMINDIASTSHLAAQYNIVDFEPSLLLKERILHLHMASHKREPLLASIIDKVFASISDDTHRQIMAKWVTLTPQKMKVPKLVLTPTEKAWLEQHPILYTTSDPSWMPYEAKDGAGNFIGIFSEITGLIAERLGVSIEYLPSNSWDEVIHKAQHKKVDFITAIPTSRREEFLRFTSPLIIKELALITQKDHAIITSLDNLPRKKIALIAGYGYNQEVLQKHPGHDYIYVDSLKQGIQGLSSNQYDIFIANITSSLYYISKEMLTDLQVAGTLDISFEVAYGVRKDWPILQQILEKALNSISDAERQDILNRWVKVGFVKKVDYSLLYQIAALFIVILGLILIWNRKLQNEIARRHAVEQALSTQHAEMQAILNTAKNLIILTDGKRLLNVNQSALNFFGYPDLDAFLKDHNCICEYFIEHDEYFHLGLVNRPEQWIKAVTELPKTQQLVLMQGAKKYNPSVFSVRINELENSNTYVVSFTDITDIKMESQLHEFNASHDPLTGLYNRLYIDRYLDHEIQKYKDLSTPVSVILLDIDYFKKVNDTYGHAVGDEVLKTLAKIMESQVRSNDKTSRWGGEEFLIVLDGTLLEQAEILAEKLRLQVQQHDFLEVPNVTCSFGVASVKPEDSIETLVKRADDALYQAKESGRNQVISKS